MKIVQYVEWTEPGEKDLFFDMVKNTKSTEELREKLIEEFKIDRMTANSVILRFRKAINQIQN